MLLVATLSARTKMQITYQAKRGWKLDKEGKGGGGEGTKTIGNRLMLISINQLPSYHTVSSDSHTFFCFFVFLPAESKKCEWKAANVISKLINACVLMANKWEVRKEEKTKKGFFLLVNFNYCRN